MRSRPAKRRAAVAPGPVAEQTARARHLARERYLLQLAYRALQIGYRKAHLGQAWIAHFRARADHLFDLALKEWIHA
ncbi:MAG: hypothetical protein PHD19_11730 [Dechloromonas sp.]|nr:hypothetical protein [Dechloromonas sp.]